MDHTHFFTLTTLKNMMLKNGFEFVFGDEIIRSVKDRFDEMSKEFNKFYKP